MDLSFWTAEDPGGRSHGAEMCREALTHSQPTSAPIKGLSPHFHLMFQHQDEGIRKGGSLVLHHDRVDQAVIQGREETEDAFQLPDVDTYPDLGQQEPLCQRAESTMSKRTWQTTQGERTWALDFSSQHYLCVLFNKSSVTLQAALFFTGHDYNAKSII